MKRKAGFCAALFLLTLTIAPAFAQDSPGQTLPSEVIGPQLIAWSLLQKPQPIPQPLPPPDRTGQPQDPQPAQPTNPGSAPDAGSQPPQPTTQVFTGTIRKDGDRYVLRSSANTVYQLDDQEKARQYESKQVRIEATLGADPHSLHIVSIELIS